MLGSPLPFSVRDASNMLLLARGQVIADEAQLEELFQRGARVEADELAEAMQPAVQESRTQRPAHLPAEWDLCSIDVRAALGSEPADMAGAIDRSTDRLLALIARAPDLALSQVVRRPGSGSGNYGVNHSIHAATACQAAARHLRWSTTEQRRAFQSALTMNVSMVDLQARLASQVSPLTAKQRETINEHPIRSAEILEQAGIQDADWLTAVRHHHEVPDGSGYPTGLKTVGELAELLRFGDIYTARMSHRATRPAMSATQAGRELHQMAAESPLAAALIKSFGIFPPGSLVRLASGELGVVTCNGQKAHNPLVATVTDATGAPRLTSLLRDTARRGSAVVALVSQQAIPMRLTNEAIACLIAGA